MVVIQLNNRCIICRVPCSVSSTCTFCASAIQSLRNVEASIIDNSVPLVVFYRYDEPIRQVILDAKVNGSLPAIAYLRSLWLDSLLTLPSLFQNSLVMSASSSLWSRVRGRTDLASLLARDLALQIDARLIRAPWYLGWRYKKRSRLGSRHQREVLNQDSAKPSIHVHSPLRLSRPLYLVDDIVTTGFTMLQLVNSVSSPSISALALAGVSS